MSLLAVQEMKLIVKDQSGEYFTALPFETKPAISTT